MKRRKGKGKGRSLAMNRHTIQNGSQKRMTSKGGLSKAMTSKKVVFARTSPPKVQEKPVLKTKTEQRFKKEKPKKELVLNRDSQPPKNSMKKYVARPSQTIRLPVTGLMILGPQMLGCFAKKFTLHGLWQPLHLANTRCSWPWPHTVDWIESGIRKTQKACIVIRHKSFVFVKSETETCTKNGRTCANGKDKFSPSPNWVT